MKFIKSICQLLVLIHIVLLLGVNVKTAHAGPICGEADFLFKYIYSDRSFEIDSEADKHNSYKVVGEKSLVSLGLFVKANSDESNIKARGALKFERGKWRRFRDTSKLEIVYENIKQSKLDIIEKNGKLYIEFAQSVLIDVKGVDVSYQESLPALELAFAEGDLEDYNRGNKVVLHLADSAKAEYHKAVEVVQRKMQTGLAALVQKYILGFDYTLVNVKRKRFLSIFKSPKNPISERLGDDAPLGKSVNPRGITLTGTKNSLRMLRGSYAFLVDAKLRTSNSTCSAPEDAD